MGTASPLAAVFSVAATGFKMAGDYVSSRAQSGADIYKAEVLEEQAQYGELKATQTNAQMTRNLAITLGHVDAVRAAMHTDPTSPTGAAVRGEMEEVGTEKKQATVESILNQVRLDEGEAAYMRSQASNALLSGDISMMGDLFSGLSGALGGPSGSGPTIGSVFGGGGGGGGTGGTAP